MRYIFYFFILPFRFLYFLFLSFRYKIQKKSSYYIEIPTHFSSSKKSPILELLSSESENLHYIDFLKQLELIKNSDKIETLAFLCDRMDYGLSELQEIGSLIEEIGKSGKKTRGYAISGDLKTLYLLSFAQERYTLETGEFTFFFPAIESIFFGKFLKSWGIEIEAFTSGKYKSFAEPFQRDKFSPSARENLTNLILSLKEQIQENLFKNTGLNWLEIQRPIMNSAYLKELGFIKDFTDEEEFRKFHNLPIIGGNTENIKEAKPISSKVLLRNNRYKNFQFFPNKKNTIAILPLKGNINIGKREEAELKEGSIHAYPVIKKLKNLAERDEVKIVVLEIDSGGGSAFASELIYREIKNLSKKKNVYAYFQNISASGGYYIGCGAVHIGSSPFCITGSIGTVLVRPNLKGLYNKLQLNKDRIEYYPGREIFSEYGTLTDYSKKFLKEEIERVKYQFYKVVCESRKITIDDLEPKAGGRVFTGAQFFNQSMVDSISGLWEYLNNIVNKENIKDFEFEYFIPFYNFKTFIKNIGTAGKYIKNPKLFIKENTSIFDYKFPFTNEIYDAIKLR